MSTTEDDNQQPWTTWEDLLLAFAVKRHGCRNWDSVATELHSRTKLHTSPDACRLKFHDLRRRFAAPNPSSADDLTVPWVEDLRRLRLDELRAEVNRHDLSISSLQSKVKQLEQDRDQSAKQDADKPSDLDNHHRDAEPADQHADESDPENQSVNGSNSTGPNKAKDRVPEQNELNPTRLIPDDKSDPTLPCSKQNESPSTSRSESSDSIAKTKRLSNETKKPNASESDGGGTKTDSDVQSSATLSRKKVGSGASAEADDGCVSGKSKPLISILALFRSHKQASFFERRLQIQETKLYDNVVRQHMDLQTIQTNLDSGSYASSHLNFFRDLLLVFTNAIIFYPKLSPEFKAAQELRSIVSHKMDEQSKQSQRFEEKLLSAPPSPRTKLSLERSDSLLGKHKPSGSGPIVVCRKRSFISAKGNSVSKGLQQSDIGDEVKTVALADLKPSSSKEESSLFNSKTKDRIVTGTRSLRRSNTSLKKPVILPNATATATTSNSNKKETAPTLLAATTEKKKEESSTSKKDDSSWAKKRGAADFLKRLKGNSPVKSKDVKSEGKSDATKGNSSTAGGEKKKNVNGDKVDGRRKITTRQSDQGKPTSKTDRATSPTKRNVGRPSKRTPEAASKRPRDTEAASASMASKLPKKRARR